YQLDAQGHRPEQWPVTVNRAVHRSRFRKRTFVSCARGAPIDRAVHRYRFRNQLLSRTTGQQAVPRDVDGNIARRGSFSVLRVSQPMNDDMALYGSLIAVVAVVALLAYTTRKPLTV